jgi:RNA polymerase sigma-70 factor (ECF subfamily)
MMLTPDSPLCALPTVGGSDPLEREPSSAVGTVRVLRADPSRAVDPVSQADGPGPLESIPSAWFHDHVDRLWRLVVRLGVPAHGADDIVQECFIIASRRRSGIASGQERSFLMGTAVRLCANYRRSARVRREVSCGEGVEREVSPLPNAEQLLVEKRWRELLDQALEALSDTHRAPFVLFELEGLSVHEIAELLALPPGTVSSRLYRARAKFAELALAIQNRQLSEER